MRLSISFYNFELPSYETLKKRIHFCGPPFIRVDQHISPLMGLWSRIAVKLHCIESCSVLMSGSGKFSEQITGMTKKRRQTAGWLLKVFAIRDKEIIRLWWSQFLNNAASCVHQEQLDSYSPGAWHLKPKSVRLWFLIGFSSCLDYFDECVTLSKWIFIIWRTGDFLWSDSSTQARQRPCTYWTMKLD